MTGPHSRWIGRRDLLLALAHQPAPADAKRIAAFFQFDRHIIPSQASDPIPPAHESLAHESPVYESPTLESLPPDRPPEIEFWHAVEVTHLPDDTDTPERHTRPPAVRLTLADLGRDGTPPVPDPPPLVAWPRLRRVMESVWNRPRSIGAIDDAEIVHRIGRGQPLTRIPRRPRPSKVPQLVVVLDRAERLTPVWRDQVDVYNQIAREFGQLGLGWAICKHGPPALSAKLGAGDAVLVLGDLGLGDPAGPQDRWRQFGEALEARGVAIAVLSPRPIDRGAARPWRVVDWTRPGPSSAAARDRLLALLAWTVRLEPALLREVRLCMPASEADLGTELDAWNHPQAIRHSAGLVFSLEFRLQCQAQLLAMLADPREHELFHKVVDVVRRRHASLPREIWLEEVRMLDMLDPRWIAESERARALVFTEGIRGLFVDHEKADLGPTADVEGWLSLSLSSRVPLGGWAGEAWGAELCATFAELHADNPDVELPPGLEIGMIPFPGERQEERQWEVRQTGDRLVVGALASLSQGTPLVVVRARRPWLVLDRRRHTLDLHAPTELGFPAGESFELATDCMHVVHRRIPRPDWANAAGRDEYGLWASFRVAAGVEQRMRWIVPGRFMMGSPASEVGRFDDEAQHEVTIAEGFWLAETPCTQAVWEAVMVTNPSRFKSPQRPVETVSWDDVQKFCAGLNRRIDSELKFGLPSEAQWEYACRAGTTTATYGKLDEIAWHDENSGRETHDVALWRPNSWGLYDVLGNVWEWCEDFYSPSHEARTADEHGPLRVIRGGSWDIVARASGRRIASRTTPATATTIRASAWLEVRGLRQENQPRNQPRNQKKQGRKKQGRGTRPAPPGVSATRNRCTMRMKYFAIPALNPEPSEEDVTRFLASHRVLGIERHFVFDGAASYWAICVTHVQSEARAPTPKRPEKIVDYREVLSGQEFVNFSRLRTLRKALADREGVPSYALFNNEQLASMVRDRIVTRQHLAAIEGVGPGRLEKYGEPFLALLLELHGEPIITQEAAPDATP